MGLRRLVTLLLVSTVTWSTHSQTNLIPNAGFEKLSSKPDGWFYKGPDFSLVSTNWTSATQASPDLYCPATRIPESWSSKGFGDQGAHSGSNMVGITAYGCTRGKPHCREYVQVGLTEPTVPGQKYIVSYWAAPLKRGYRINSLGAYFSPTKVSGNTDRLLELTPQVFSKEIISDYQGSWVRQEFEFVADEAYRYFLIGNFFDDDETLTKEGDQQDHFFAYYYLDDVSVTKTAPFLTTKDPLADWYPLEEGRVIEIQVLFDVDKHTLKNRAQRDLDKLLLLLQQYQHMHIEISGHTDSTGDFLHNMDLSDRRSKAVLEYLVDHGVQRERMISSGHGPNKPVATNATGPGRQLNRRVEFRILSM